MLDMLSSDGAGGAEPPALTDSINDPTVWRQMLEGMAAAGMGDAGKPPKSPADRAGSGGRMRARAKGEWADSDDENEERQETERRRKLREERMREEEEEERAAEQRRRKRREERMKEEEEEEKRWAEKMRQRKLKWEADAEAGVSAGSESGRAHRAESEKVARAAAHSRGALSSRGEQASAGARGSSRGGSRGSMRTRGSGTLNVESREQLLSSPIPNQRDTSKLLRKPAARTGSAKKSKPPQQPMLHDSPRSNAPVSPARSTHSMSDRESPVLIAAAEAAAAALGKPLGISRSGSDKSNGIVDFSDKKSGRHTLGEVKMVQAEFGLRLLSTWGQSRTVGLTQIDLFDEQLRRIEIIDHSSRAGQATKGGKGKAIMLCDCVGVPLKSTSPQLARVIDGVSDTTNEKNMWVGRLPQSGPLLINISIVLPAGSTVGRVKVWNYNKNLLMSSIGARDVEILMGGACVWSGEIQRGCGTVGVDYSSTIDLADDLHKRQVQTNAAATTSTTGEPVWLSGGHQAAGVGAGASGVGAFSKAGGADHGGLQQERDKERRRRRRGGEELDSTGGYSSKAPSSSDQPTSTEEREEERRQRRRQKEAGGLAGNDALAAALGATGSGGGQPGPQDKDLHASWVGLQQFKPDKIDNNALAAAAEAAAAPAAVPTTSPTKAKPKKPISLAELMAQRAEEDEEDEELEASLAALETPGLDQSVVAVAELPVGMNFELRILSTWGDPHYVGLAGLELFDERGRPVSVSEPKAQIVADPPDVNILPGYGSDPRTVDNLLDGVCHTCDDLHLWLAPLTDGARESRDGKCAGPAATVTLTLDSPVRLAMVRIWNYNKSRTHSYRGAREVELRLDGQLIFAAEVRKAPGMMLGVGQCSETILFTMDADILERIQARDRTANECAHDETDDVMGEVLRQMEAARPPTPTGAGGRPDGKLWRRGRAEPPPMSFDEQRREDGIGSAVHERPRTQARLPPPPPAGAGIWEAEGDTGRAEAEEDGALSAVNMADMPVGRHITLQLLSTWGDPHYIGMAGIQLLVPEKAKTGQPPRLRRFPLSSRHMDASPRDLRALGYEEDPRTLEKLVDGDNDGVDMTHMWMVPFSEQEPPQIRIDLGREMPIAALELWNYNKSDEDTARGVKKMTFELDGRTLVHALAVRKATGVAGFSGQRVNLHKDGMHYLDGHVSTNREWAVDPNHRVAKITRPLQYQPVGAAQDFAPPLMPEGFVFKFVLVSTWGDPYYLGLNGIELINAHGAPIHVRREQVHAVPHSVNEVFGDEQDARIPSNLFNGRNDSWEAGDAWLAPLASSLGPEHQEDDNLLYVTFDEPTTLSMVRIWNYAKNPERGVSLLELWVDNLLVFRGGTKPAPTAESVADTAHVSASLDSSASFEASRGSTGGEPQRHNFSQSILFTNDRRIVEEEKSNGRIHYCGGNGQDVLEINEYKVMQESKESERAPDPRAEGIVADMELRPMTSVAGGRRR
jgi:hypothetical protein